VIPRLITHRSEWVVRPVTASQFSSSLAFQAPIGRLYAALRCVGMPIYPCAVARSLAWGVWILKFRVFGVGAAAPRVSAHRCVARKRRGGAVTGVSVVRFRSSGTTRAIGGSKRPAAVRQLFSYCHIQICQRRALV
jgi:hypothetical protein